MGFEFLDFAGKFDIFDMEPNETDEHQAWRTGTKNILCARNLRVVWKSFL